MRAGAPLALLAATLVLLAPFAAAGPFADLPVATHESGCGDELVGEFNDPNGWQYEYGCSERHYVRQGIDGVATVEVGERARAQHAEDYGPTAAAVDDVNSAGTYAVVEAGPAALEVEDACGTETHQELTYLQPGDEANEVRVADGLQGCWKEATLDVDGERVARAYVVDGCASHDESESSTTAPMDHQGLFRDHCGNVVGADAAGEHASGTYGSSCATQSLFTDSGPLGPASQVREHCSEGVIVRGPADTFVFVGYTHGSTTECSTSCHTYQTPTTEGVLIDTVVPVFVPVPGLRAIIEALP